MVQEQGPNASQEAWKRQTGYQTPTQQTSSAVDRANARRQPTNRETVSRSFWDKHPSGLDPVLTAQMKDDIVGSGAVFNVVRVKFQTGGKYGDTWWVTVELNGQLFGAPFQDNEVRHDVYEDLKTAVDQHGPILASMRSYATEQGVGYDLCAPYEPENEPPF